MAPTAGGSGVRLRAAAEALVAFALPAVCLACGEALPGGRIPLGLCRACRGRLCPQPPGCAVCARPLAVRPLPDGYRCGRCRGSPPGFDRLLVAWSYRPPLEAVVRGLKFGRLDYLGAHLARELAVRFGGELRGLEAVVPVPLHWRRRIARGYNQAEEIARPLAAALGAPLLRALARRRATVRQTSLPRAERLKNPRRAFGARRWAPVEGKRLLLVDDVVTTGATLSAAAAALRRAGAARVVAVAAARTPEETAAPPRRGPAASCPGDGGAAAK